MRIYLAISVGAVMLCTLACSASTDPEVARTALRDADRAWAAAAKAGDIDKVITFWTEDAIDYFPGARPAIGRTAIAELVKANRSRPGFSLTWDPIQVVVSRAGDMGYTSGTFQLSANDQDGRPVARSGHYLCIWHRQVDGSWKCAVETSVFSQSSAP
jgi:ketosteroid isomerase-like protein